MTDPSRNREGSAAAVERVTRERTRVWDVPARVVHWGLVVLIALSWYTAENRLMDYHRLSGYAILALVSFRIVWGFAGSSTARFSQFVSGPRAVGAYVATLHRRDARAETPGHNPLGAWSVLALLATILVQIVSGLFAVDIDGLESGPLSDRISFDQGRVFSDVHDVSFTMLQILVVAHLLAILFYLVYKRQNLLGSMITGSRRGPGEAMRPGSRIVMILTAVIAAGLAWFVSQGLRL